MTNPKCACPSCNCELDNHAVQRGGQRYCCDACANGHANGEACQMGQCGCATPASGGDRRSS